MFAFFLLFGICGLCAMSLLGFAYAESPKSMVAGEALTGPSVIRIGDSDNEVYYCDAGEDWDGFLPVGTWSEGDTVPVIFPTAGQTVELEAAAAITAGADVFPADDGEIDDVAIGRRIGRMLKTSAAADGDVVEVLVLDGAPSVLKSAVAESSEVENTTDETDFDEQCTIQANTLKPGDIILVKAAVIVNDQNSTDTCLIKFYIGGTAYITTNAVDVADNDIALVDVLIKVRTIGATGTMVVYGIASDTDAEGAGSVQMGHQYAAIASIDTTSDITIKLSATWSVAHADNEVALADLTVVKLP
jgi:hypothetical protein